MTIAFFSSPPYRSLAEKKNENKARQKTKQETKPGKTKRKKKLPLALFRLKWLQISLGSQFSKNRLDI